VLLLTRTDVLLCDVELEGHAEGIRVLETAREQRPSAAVLPCRGAHRTASCRSSPRW
jgi:DNA-binding NarL/FixJ family response regulator